MTIHRIGYSLASIWLGLLAGAAIAADDDSHALAAHAHGEARLMLIQEGREVLIELVSPAANLLGFEHRPATAAQHNTVRGVAALLANSDNLFRLPAALQCRADPVEVQSPLFGESSTGHADHADHDNHAVHDDHHDHNTDHAESAGHADISLQLHYHCASDQPVKQLELRLLARFPALERVRAEWVTDAGQGSATVTARQPMLMLSPP